MNYGKNVEASVSDGILTIKIDLGQDHGLSKSGKSVTVASTAGNVSVHETIKGHIFLGLNCYQFVQPKPSKQPE